MPALNQEVRQSFDYQHGGCKHEAHALAIRDALRQEWTNAEVEDSGDLFRVWVPIIGGYFWPEDDSEERWNHAV